MIALLILFQLASLAISAADALHIRHTGRHPTGYVVDFVFTPNATQRPSKVTLGGFPFFGDSLHTSGARTQGISPYQWRPGQYSIGLFVDPENATYTGISMAKSGDTWNVTVPLPSGSYQYQFLLDCDQNWGPTAPNCTVVADPTNLPLGSEPGLLSTVDVPFDRQFQRDDYDWLLPAKDQGSVKFLNYHSPGSTFPSKDIHYTGIYLPPGYNSKRAYPVLYLSHGGGDNGGSWINKGRIQNIADRLIGSGKLEPTIIVTPAFYNLGFTQAQFATNSTSEGFDVDGLNLFFNAVREKYIDYLIPFIESQYLTSRRAFGGLSLGGGLTLTMLFNATDRFESFCIMSNTPAPMTGDKQYANGQLSKVGIFTGAGLYDLALENSINAQSRFTAAGLQYLSHYPQQSAHQWLTWQEIARVYLEKALWKPVPYGAST